MGSTSDVNSLKKKLKDPNRQNVSADGVELLDEDEQQMIDEAAKKRALMNRKMNRKTLNMDERLTEKTRKNLALDPRY